MDSIIDDIRLANPKRKHKNLDRRLLKCGEELGEAMQAYLAVTSKNNLKNKSWADVREELVDTIIVAVDCLWTAMPDQPKHMTEVERFALIQQEFARKLSKWDDKRSTQQTVVDDSE